MRRIAGIVNFDRTPAEYMRLRMISDGMDFQQGNKWHFQINGNAGMACNYIGIDTDAVEDTSPYCPSDKQRLVTFDGRIDNRTELLHALSFQLSMHNVQVSDEKLVLAAYEKWGSDFPKHLSGDFAVAIWDKNAQSLICARDYFGVKPFYYFHSEHSVSFASNPAVILALGKSSPCLHEERIADYLVDPLEGVDKTCTFFNEIFRLPPGCILTAISGGISIHQYYELNPFQHQQPKTEGEYIEEFQELLVNAVRCRLGNSAASMLSGGMDSSSIVAVGRLIMAHEQKHPLEVFSANSRTQDINREPSHINAMLKQGNIRAHVFSEIELLDCMDQLVVSIEHELEPFDCLMNLNRLIYLKARENKLVSVLDGVDGDVLLSGFDHLLQLWRDLDLHAILNETVAANGLVAEYRIGNRLIFTSLRSFIAILAPNWIQSIYHRFLYRDHRISRYAVKKSILNREFAMQSVLAKRFALVDDHNPRPKSLSQIDFHTVAVQSPFLTVGLERYERVASQFGIEARHPLLDVRLVEFCLSLPWNIKTRRGWTKYILRKAMEPYLPHEVVWRRDKDSLMWEYNRFILKHRADYFHQATLDEREILRPYVDIQKLERFWQDYLTRGDETHAEQLWSGIALAFWLRRHKNFVAGLSQQH